MRNITVRYSSEYLSFVPSLINPDVIFKREDSGNRELMYVASSLEGRYLPRVIRIVYCNSSTLHRDRKDCRACECDINKILKILCFALFSLRSQRSQR